MTPQRKAYERARRADPDTWAHLALTNCRQRARKRLIPCTITAEDIRAVIPKDGRCPVFNVELRFGGGRSAYNPSVDEVIAGKGYVPGNIVVVSSRANVAKSDLTIVELRRLLEFYERMVMS